MSSNLSWVSLILRALICSFVNVLFCWQATNQILLFRWQLWMKQVSGLSVTNHWGYVRRDLGNVLHSVINFGIKIWIPTIFFYHYCVPLFNFYLNVCFFLVLKRRAHNDIFQTVKKRSLKAVTKLQSNKIPNNSNSLSSDVSKSSSSYKQQNKCEDFARNQTQSYSPINQPKCLKTSNEHPLSPNINTHFEKVIMNFTFLKPFILLNLY